MLEDWLDVGQGGPGDELVELYSHLISIISHMAEVLLHHHLAGLPPQAGVSPLPELWQLLLSTKQGWQQITLIVKSEKMFR